MNGSRDKQVIDTHTHTRTQRQTQATTIPEGQNWPRVKKTPVIRSFVVSFVVGLNKTMINRVAGDLRRLNLCQCYVTLMGLSVTKECDWWDLSGTGMKHFPRYRALFKVNPRPPVDSPHKGQWRGALAFSLIFSWTNSWANSRDAGDLMIRHGANC